MDAGSQRHGHHRPPPSWARPALCTRNWLPSGDGHHVDGDM